MDVRDKILRAAVTVFAEVGFGKMAIKILRKQCIEFDRLAAIKQFLDLFRCDARFERVLALRLRQSGRPAVSGNIWKCQECD